VVVSERAVTVGPFVEPGLGPCLHCVHLARTDLDPAWPALAAQLWGRAPRELACLERAEAAAFVARKVLARLAGEATRAESWPLTPDAGVSVREWTQHPDCRCAAPAGTDWAGVRFEPAAPRAGEPTRARVFAVPG